MFTGLVEHLGEITKISPTTEYEGYSFVISNSAVVLSDCSIGDSIAVNGCCLTVTEFDAEKGDFTVGLSNETLDRTDLGSLKVGGKVNLERAMSGHGRFGGHFVQGHIDCTATLISAFPDGDSIRLLFHLPLDFHLALIPKGYIALDGTSLTLTSLAIPKSNEPNYLAGHGTFGVMLIAHTQSRTVVAEKTSGMKVNVECDVVGKGLVNVVQNVLESGGEGSALEKLVERVVERALEKRGLTEKSS